MLPASNRGVGMNIGFPDVCNTPVGPATVPIPYPNLALNATAAPFSPNVMVSYMNALNMGSAIPMTMGDEAGLAHPTIKGPSRYTMGNPVVKVNYMPAINLLCPTTGNNMNNGLGAVLVPSVTNVFFTREISGGEAGASPLEEVAGAANGPSVSATFADATLEIHIATFGPHTPAELGTVLDAATDRGVRSVVIDLRGNAGGELASAFGVLDQLLPVGTVLAGVVDPDGDVTWVEARAEEFSDLPVTVLVDSGTASAAEVVVTALAVHGRATVRGCRTYGKATVHQIVATPDGPAYAIAARCLAPDGSSWQGVGLEPAAPIER